MSSAEQRRPTKTEGGEAEAAATGALPGQSDFTTLGLSRPVLDAIADAGYTVPTPIQAEAIPLIVQGRDVMGLAQTGTGKTPSGACFAYLRTLSST